MKFTNSISVVDSHTQGNPTRVVIGGLPPILGKTMIDKMNYVRSNLDDLVTGIQWEPRGHDDIFLTIITSPVNPEANFGVVYKGQYEYFFMCGHGTIGTVTVAIETGIVKANEPFTDVLLDTPSGLVSAKARVENGSVKSVTIRNVPSFLYKKDVYVEIPKIGKVRGDISFGGDFFYITESSELGINLDTIQIEELIQIGSKIKNAVNNSISVSHPVIKEVHEIHGTIINGPPTNPKADCRNLAFSGTHVDRSPCGTGTCAKMAALFGRGKLKKGDIFITESILGTTYEGKIVDEIKFENYNAIIPEITGQAWISGFNNLLIDPEDPFKYGFRLKDKIIKRG